MSSRKRNTQAASSAVVEDGQCTIKLADASLAADFTALRACSSCARGLPVDAQEWDLSGLQVDGQPVSRATVEAWLACVDSVLAGSPLDGPRKEQLSTATGLQQLLLFADAVGSLGGVMNACLSELKDLMLSVQVGSETIKLRMGRDAGGYSVDEENLVLHYSTLQFKKSGWQFKFGDDDGVVNFRRDVATQTEALLYVGHMLQLPQLLQTVHGFIFRSHVMDEGLLRTVLHRVFTERVLAAAVGSSQLSRDAYMTSVLTHACSANDGVGLHRLLEAVHNKCWDAQLSENFFGCPAGVDLQVQLDMLSFAAPSIRFNEFGPWLRAQILLGHGIYNEETREELLQDDK